MEAASHQAKRKWRYGGRVVCLGGGGGVAWSCVTVGFARNIRHRSWRVHVPWWMKGLYEGDADKTRINRAGANVKPDFLIELCKHALSSFWQVA